MKQKKPKDDEKAKAEPAKKPEVDMVEKANLLFLRYHAGICKGWLVVSTLYWWLGLLPGSLGAACGAWVGFFWMLRQLSHLSLRFSSPCASAA